MLKNTFCSSPWFHFRLTYDGSYEKCRWLKSAEHTHNIATTSPIHFFEKEMESFRSDFVNGVAPPECETCYYQEQFGKLSGRQKQLLKSGIRTDDFVNSIKSSPHYSDFFLTHRGFPIDREATDIQVDIGNICNSACIMCDPVASSRLTQDYNKLSAKSTLFVKPENYTSWVNDPNAMQAFLDFLQRTHKLKYLHLLGGETLYNDAFYIICHHLIQHNICEDVIIGTTTNGTIYTEELEHIIPKFKEFHLGISIETVTPLNDYIRYPSKITDVLANIDRFIALRAKHPGLHLTLRITPNVFTVYELDTLFEYMIENNITAEACNILHKPSCLRMELMPSDIRQEVIAKLEAVVEKHSISKHNVSNIRSQHLVSQVIADTILDYLEFVKSYTAPDNKEQLQKELVEFLKAFESIRNNSILDYAPRYTEFLRLAGY